jgi:hypothetical protein
MKKFNFLQWRQNRMMGTDSTARRPSWENHCRIVAESLAGKRDVDEQTFASLAILDERLERLRNLGGAFSGIEFSPDAAKLLKQKNAVTIG